MIEGYVVFGHLQEKLNRDCSGWSTLYYPLVSVIFVVEEAFLVCLSDFCLIFYSFVKMLFSNIFKLMLNFVLSYMSSTSSVNSNF